MNRKVEKNPLEWAVFAVSLVVVLATLGYLVYDAATARDEDPDLQVELGRPEPRSGGFAVPVTVHNRGGETAEGVRVEVELAIPGAEPERAELDIAFIPRQSKRQGWVTLRSDPSQGRLTGRAIGYEQP